jgi:hypothetical protein
MFLILLITHTFSVFFTGFFSAYLQGHVATFAHLLPPMKKFFQISFFTPPPPKKKELDAYFLFNFFSLVRHFFRTFCLLLDLFLSCSTL